MNAASCLKDIRSFKFKFGLSCDLIVGFCWWQQGLRTSCQKGAESKKTIKDTPRKKHDVTICLHTEEIQSGRSRQVIRFFLFHQNFTFCIPWNFLQNTVSLYSSNPSVTLFLVTRGNFTFSIQIAEPVNLLTFYCLLYLQGWLVAAWQQYSCSAAGHKKCEDNWQKQMKREWEGVYVCRHSSLWEKWITSLCIKEWFPTGAILTTRCDFCQTM